MKEIKAIIQPFMLTSVINALRDLEDVPGVTVSEVKGFGKSRGKDAVKGTTEDFPGYGKKVKLEIVLADDRVKEVLDIIAEKAHTGKAGDGKIFVYTVDDVVRIRTGEHE